MDLMRNFGSATAQLLGDPLAAQHGATPVKKREAIGMVTAIATVYFFLPDCLWVCKAIFNIVLLGWLTALAFDAKEAGMDAWDGIPTWLKRYLGGGGGVALGRRIQRPGFESPLRDVPSSSRLRNCEKWSERSGLARLTRGAVWGYVRALLIRYLRMVLHYLDPSQESPREDTSQHSPALSPTHGGPTSTGWYAILVRTPPVHGYGFFGPQTKSWDHDMDVWDSPEASSLPWQETSTSCIPSLMESESLAADLHLALYLVEKTYWESPNATLAQKMAKGRYWDIRGQYEWQRGEKWTEDQVRDILGIEVLGLAQASNGGGVVDSCNSYFDALREDWEYRNISWNDVDFAILLGLLVTGRRAEEKAKTLFQTLEALRFEQLLLPRAQLGAGLMTAVGAMAILGTGGLAAPFVGPMVLGKFGASGVQLGQRDQRAWDQRLDATQRVVGKFPQLKPLTEVPKAGRAE